MGFDRGMRVSIIIPVYNVEQYIEACLDSVFNQTMTNEVECIIVDDRGKDNSIKRIEHWLVNKEYNIRHNSQNIYISNNSSLIIKLLRHESNRGLSAARNTGIANATGDYLYFLDSDDKISPDCIESLYNKVQKYGDVDLVHGIVTHLDIPALYKRCEYSTNIKEIKEFLLLFYGSVMSAQNRLIKREFLLQNNLWFKEGIVHEDCYWSFFLAKHVRSIAFHIGETYIYTINPNSITNKVNIQKESHSYRTILRDFACSIDSISVGCQKAYILNCFLIFFSNNYYISEKDKNETIKQVLGVQNSIERFLLISLINISNHNIKQIIVRLLFRIYKISQ